MGRQTRPPRWGGTIAGWELTRLARRGSPTVARLLVGLLLFAALLVTYLAAFPEDLDRLQRIDPGSVQNKLAQFGQEFALTLLLVQAGVVVLLTPFFVAGAIVEETERRTLEFLLATDLEPREVILGKLWPRLLLVFGFVLVGWPVLAATQVWGGVDALFVALASAVVVASTWAMAGISAACAVGATTLRRALVRSYFWSAIWLTLPVITCPFSLIYGLANAHEALANPTPAGPGPPFGRAPGAPASPADVWGPMVFALLLQAALTFLIGFLGVRRACFKLRHARYFYARMPWQQKPRKVEKWERHPPVPQGSPLLWKELYLSGQTVRFVRMLSLVPWGIWLCVSSVFMVVGWAFIITGTGHDDVLASMNQLVRWGGGFVVVVMALMVGLHAAGSVARERQQETLTDLMSVPRPRREILWAKWVGSMAKARGIALGALSVPLVGVLAEGISYWAVLPLLLAAFTFLACAASFGLWLSVRSRTVQRATGLWLLVVGLWVGGTLLAAEAAYMEEQSPSRFAVTFPPPEPATLVWDRAVNPLLAWSQLVFRLRDTESSGYDSYRDRWRDGAVGDLSQVLPSLLGIAAYAGLAWALYRLAARRFEREGQG